MADYKVVITITKDLENDLAVSLSNGDNIKDALKNYFITNHKDFFFDIKEYKNEVNVVLEEDPIKDAKIKALEKENKNTLMELVHEKLENICGNDSDKKKKLSEVVLTCIRNNIVPYSIRVPVGYDCEYALLDADVHSGMVRMIRDGKSAVDCIKFLRSKTGWGLKESKDVFDSILADFNSGKIS